MKYSKPLDLVIIKYESALVYKDIFGKVAIKDNAYIGTNVLVMTKVTIGSDVAVTVGSVVTKPVEDGVVNAGNPAKEGSPIDIFREKLLEKMWVCNS